MLCRFAARASAPSLALARGPSTLTPTATATALTTTAIQARHSSSFDDPPDSVALPFPWRPSDMKVTECDLYLEYGDSYIWHIQGTYAMKMAVDAFDNRRKMAAYLRPRLGDNWYWIMLEASRRKAISHKTPQAIAAKSALREEMMKGKSDDEASARAYARELRDLDWKLGQHLREMVKTELEQGTLTIEEIKERTRTPSKPTLKTLKMWPDAPERQPTSSESEHQPTSSESERQPTSSESERQPTSSASEHQPTSSESEHQPTSSAL